MNHATYTAKVRMDRARAEWRRLERAVDAAKEAAGAARVAYHAAHLAFHSLKGGEREAGPPEKSGTYWTDRGVGLPVEMKIEMVPGFQPRPAAFQFNCPLCGFILTKTAYQGENLFDCNQCKGTIVFQCFGDRGVIKSSEPAAPWGRSPSPEEIKEDMNQLVAFVGDVPVYDDPEAWEAAGELCEYCGGLGGNGGDDVCPACEAPENNVRRLGLNGSKITRERGERMPKPRLSVRVFSQWMEKNLKANDWKGGWDDCSFLYLYAKLIEECSEIMAAIVRRSPTVTVMREAADIANVAMMIADLYKKQGIKEDGDEE